MFSRYAKPTGSRVPFPQEQRQPVWDRLGCSYENRLKLGVHHSVRQNIPSSGNYPSVRMRPSGFHPGERSSGFHPSKRVRPSENFISQKSQQEWRVKLPSVAAVELGKGKENINADSLILSTETFTTQQPTVHSNPTEPILVIAPKHSANDHEASTSQVKPIDPKYTQPRWCPSGLTKTQKRKL